MKKKKQQKTSKADVGFIFSFFGFFAGKPEVRKTSNNRAHYAGCSRIYWLAL
jgi:hypothetical protein